MNSELAKVSKFLSLILRHQPRVIHADLDVEGWLEIDELISKASKYAQQNLTRALIEKVVQESDKQRFAISSDGNRIRANQGHSVPGVEIQFTSIEPPEILFHGTIAKSRESIHKSGLQKMQRHHVHLSPDLETARKVGSRRGNPIILIILARKMFQAGFEFYRSENGVWLTDHVPPEFIKQAD